MRHVLSSLLIAMFFGLLAAGEPPKTALDKVDPKKIPATLKPKGTPKDVMAVLGDRDGRYDSLAFRPDGGALAVGGPDGRLRVYDMSTFKLTGSTLAKDVPCITYSPSGKTLAAGDAAGNLRYWSVPNGPPGPASSSPGAHKGGPVWAIAFSADGKSFFSAGADKTIKVWDSTTIPPKLHATLTGHEDRVRGLAVSSDGKLLASTSDRDKTVRLWSLGNKPKEFAKIALKSGAVSVAFAPDGSTLAVGCLDGTLQNWKIGDKIEELNPIAQEKGNFYSIAYSPNGKSLLGLVKINQIEDRVCVWNLEGKELYESKHGRHVEAVAWDPGGQHIVIANETSLFVVRIE